MSRIKSISLLAGAAIGIASVANAQTSRDAGLALSAEIAAMNSATGSALQASTGPSWYGHTKIRLNFNSRDDVPGGAEDTAQGFSMPESRLGVTGTIGKWGYTVAGDFDADGDFAMSDAFATNDWGNGWVSKMGQLKAPFLREETVSDTGLMSVDRSTLNTAYSMGRVQGSMHTYTAENWRGTFGLSDGARSENTDFTSIGEADFSITARFEYLLSGADWSVFDDFTSFQGSDNSYMLGAAIQYQTGGESFADVGGSTLDLDILGVTADFTAEGNGWSAFAEFVFISIEPDVGDNRDDFGIVVQGSYFLAETWEGFARYSYTSPDDPLEDFSALTLGVNKYLIPNSHAAKFTIAGDVFLDEQDTSVVPANTNNNLLASGSDSQWGLRAQLQLVY